MFWDWSAAFLGLGPAEDVFLPAYWRLAAGLTSPCGFLPEPRLVLTGLVAVMVLLWSALFWSSRQWPHVVMFVLAGALMADTPYAVALPAVAFGSSMLIARLAYERRLNVFKASLSGGVLLLALALGFVAGVILNLGLSGVGYVPGYFRNALSLLRDAGVRHPRVAAKMDRMLDRYVEELVREVGSCEWVFTDGTSDAGVAYAAWRGGRTLRTIPLIGLGADGKCSSWSGIARPEDLAALRTGSGDLLRFWAVDRPDRLKSAAFQCGFSFLKQTVKSPLANAGLVKRVEAIPSAELDRVARFLTALASDICDFCRAERIEQGGRLRAMRFSAMQWCVAEALRRTSEDLARSGQESLVRTMIELAGELDEVNPVLEKCRSATSLSSAVASCALTPYEGLRLSLKHADFPLARGFAQKILQEDADHVEANFAMGMDCFVQRKFAESRHYLQRALEGRPREPALLNNVALASLELGDLRAAEKYARAAAEVAPDSPEVKDTLARVKAAVNRAL